MYNKAEVEAELVTYFLYWYIKSVKMSNEK